MFTEALAKTKLCPFIRRGESNTGGMCAASQCMAWRWVLTKETLSPEQTLGAGTASGLARALQPTIFVRGYCGAAGIASGSPHGPANPAPPQEQTAC